jgi:hypothetical protein
VPLVFAEIRVELGVRITFWSAVTIEPRWNWNWAENVRPFPGSLARLLAWNPCT